MRRSVRLGVAGFALVAVVASGGCILAADLLNPGFLGSLGLDPETVLPGSGVIVVVCSNDTSGVANFVVGVLDEGYQTDTTGESVSQLVANDVASGESRSLVVECPIGAIDPLGVFIITEAGATQVEFQGSLLRSGIDFGCGSVVNFQAIEPTDGQFATRVQILAGR